MHNMSRKTDPTRETGTTSLSLFGPKDKCAARFVETSRYTNEVSRASRQTGPKVSVEATSFTQPSSANSGASPLVRIFSLGGGGG